MQQVVNPVLWEASQRALLALGCDEFYEVGPGRVLRGLLKRIDRKTGRTWLLQANIWQDVTEP